MPKDQIFKVRSGPTQIYHRPMPLYTYIEKVKARAGLELTILDAVPDLSTIHYISSYYSGIV